MAPTDSKLLKKMYLLNEVTFEKLKDIENTERNFGSLDKAMREILYNKKINNHDKLLLYTNLLNKYLNLRKQLIAKHGNTAIKEKVLQKEVKKDEQQTKNPFDTVNLTNFPRLSNVFKPSDTIVDPDNFQFEHTLGVVPGQNMDFSMAELSEKKTPSPQKEDLFVADGEEDQYVNLPATSAASVARKSIAGDVGDVSMRDADEIVPIEWKGIVYTITKLTEKDFRTFLKKIELKYPKAKRVELKDFTNYLVNGKVSITTLDKETPYKLTAVARKRKTPTTSNLAEKRKKETSVIDHFRVKKKASSLRTSVRQQTGKGLKNKIKWKTFR